MNAVPRQGYFLGGIGDAIGDVLGKAGKVVKQVVKSPVGKAALIGLGGAGLMGMGPLSGLGGIGARIGGSGIGQFFKGMGPKLFRTAAGAFAGPMPYLQKGVQQLTPGILGKLGLTKGGGSMMPTILGGVTAAGLMTYFMQKGKTEEEATRLAQDVKRGKGLGLDLIKADIKKYRTGDLSSSQMFDKGYHFLTPRDYIGAKGGRVGYALGDLVKKVTPTATAPTGGVQMGNTLAENIAANKAQAAGIEGILAQGRSRLPGYTPQQTYTPQQARALHENLDQATGGARGVAANVTGPPTQDDISAAIAANQNTAPVSYIAPPEKTGWHFMDRPDWKWGDPLPGGATMDDPESYESIAYELGVDPITKKWKGNQGGRVGLKDSVKYMTDQELEELYPSLARGEMYDYDKKKAIERRKKKGEKKTKKSKKEMMAQGGRIGYEEGTPEPEFIGIKKAVEERPTENTLMEIAKVIFRLTPPGMGMFAGEKAVEMYQNLDDEDKEKVQEFGKKSLRFAGIPGMAASAGMSLYDKFKDNKAQGGRIGFNSGGLSEYEIFKLKELKYDVNKYGADHYGGLKVLREILDLHGYNKGGRIGKFGGGMGVTMPSIPTGMPRVNTGGIRELDYRQSGGFVPVGVKEKADDVPAMLSKNEFVMTADAVKAAGGGSVEKGAQRMYDTMKQLEGKVV